MDDIPRQLAARDRMRRRLALQATPAERVRDMMRLSQATWDLLRQSPEGYAHFLRRNFKARAIVVRDANAT
jgi:hypothetical protein